MASTPAAAWCGAIAPVGGARGARSGAHLAEVGPSGRANTVRPQAHQRHSQSDLISLAPKTWNAGYRPFRGSQSRRIAVPHITAVYSDTEYTSSAATTSQRSKAGFFRLPRTEDELRMANYAVNLSFIACATAAACTKVFAVQASAWPDWESWEHMIRMAESAGWDFYARAVRAHPLETKAIISGLVYVLGDLTAQIYEGRTSQQFDLKRIIRSGLCGFLAHGPLSHFYFQYVDQLTASLLGHGRDWTVPLAKIAVDQTAWAFSWNTLYFLLLGLLKMEHPRRTFSTIQASSWSLLSAGWRFWPFAHLLTYTLIPTNHRLLYVDTMELVWVTVLSYYGHQRQRYILKSAAQAAVAASEPPVAQPNYLMLQEDARPSSHAQGVDVEVLQMGEAPAVHVPSIAAPACARDEVSEGHIVPSPFHAKETSKLL